MRKSSFAFLMMKITTTLLKVNQQAAQPAVFALQLEKRKPFSTKVPAEVTLSLLVSKGAAVLCKLTG